MKYGHPGAFGAQISYLERRRRLVERGRIAKWRHEKWQAEARQRARNAAAQAAHDKKFWPRVERLISRVRAWLKEARDHAE